MGARTVLTTLITTALALFLGGCHISYAPSVPDGYAGPLANIKDSVTVQSEQEVDFFYVDAIDGRKITNSPVETRVVNSGRGTHMTPIVLDHDLPAVECKVTIVGRNEFAADILALMNTVYEVRGDVLFRPESDGIYVVKGEISGDYSAVWIEDRRTGKIVTEKIEVNGSAAKGFFK